MSDSSLGSRLKQLRTARGVTQSQLADQLFVSRKTVSSWETGRNQPDLQTICQLASYYQLTVDDLIHQQSVPYASDQRPITWLGPAFAIILMGRLGFVALPAMLLLSDFVVIALAWLLVNWWRRCIHLRTLRWACSLLAVVFIAAAWLNLFKMDFGLQLIYLAAAITLLIPIAGAGLIKRINSHPA
ncbi:helix-turn-helix transcriptional regulator [Lacticaseibacillus paracasei]|uniref:helix-turn-helix transcriptional regulator n=1 Tax=Lacticaseibacillus paracasei TaxID=1597 RepID=UPI0022EC23A8|nr:helix-turn-helix transcriptional regulator [Lacticaseibacillus paracasei]WBS98846.1 helix-turn-helix transcriptional regulator [Lacticaseibacillus paracasei]